MGLDACVEAANLIESGNAPKIPQDDSKATYESWCKKSDARIDWKKPGNEIYNLIRGCNPQPGAWLNLWETSIHSSIVGLLMNKAPSISRSNNIN